MNKIVKLNAKQLRSGQLSVISRQTIKKNEIYIILDNVLDTYNIGSIFRLVDAVNAKKIYLLESTDILRADAVSQEKVKNSGKVEIITMVKLQEIFGDEFVKGIKYEDCQKGGVKKLVIDGIFVSIGYQPNTEIVKNLVELNKAGEIVVEHKTQKTSCEGIWAAGDIADGLYHQSNIAIGDAIKAVLNISNYLNKK